MEEHIALKHIINMRHTIILISEIIDNINDNIYTFECVENKLIGLYKDLLESSYNIEAYINTYDLNDGKNRVYDKLLDVVTLYQRRTSNFITHTNKAIFPEQIIIPPPSSELYWLIRKFSSSKIVLHNWGTANKFRKYINTEVQPIKKIEGSQSKSDSCTFATVLITLSDSEKKSIIERIKGIINPNITPKDIAIILVALKQMQLLTLSNISLLARVWYNEFGFRSALKSLQTGLSNHISGDHTKFERNNKDDIEVYKNQLQQ